MALVRRIGVGRYFAPSAETLTAIGIGAAGAITALAISLLKVKVAMIAIMVIPVLAVVILRPRLGMLLLIFAMGFIEEFPGGIGGDEFARSERTPFYAAKLGLPAFYIPDAFVGGLLILYLLKAVIWRSDVSFKLDKIGVAFCLLGGAILLSLIIPLFGPDPFGPRILDLSLIGSITLPEWVARFIGVLQFKLFLIIFPSYIIGLFFFQKERDIKQTLTVLTIAMAGTIMLGLFRLVRDPSMIKGMVPVIFDTASVWLMAMAVFYVVGVWACSRMRPGRSIIQAVFCALLMLFILLSYRRTMWGAVAIAAVMFPFILPRHARGRLLLLVGIGVCAILAVLGITPAGHAIIQSIISRLGETNLNQGSTLYRFALFVWTVEKIWDLPLFGYGIAPLWNEIIRIRFFATNLENVHSLYFWILLRMGIVGFLVSGVSIALIMLKMREVYRKVDEERYKIMVGVIFLSIVMYLFNGIFNPVYANVRHLVPLGLMLALVTRLPYIIAERKADISPVKPA